MSNGARTSSARDLRVRRAVRPLRFFRLFVFLRRRDLHLDLRQDVRLQLEQLERAGGCDALSALEAVGDLHLAAVADADGDFAAVRLVVLVDDDRGRGALGAGGDGVLGKYERARDPPG